MARLRPVAGADLVLLAQRLPGVLPGNWTPAAMAALQQRQHLLRVLELVGADDPTPVGFAEYQCIVDEAHLYGIAIFPPWQRQGHGGRLLALLLAEQQAAGCTRCLLEVRQSNLAAQALYRAAGFSCDGLRPGYYPAGPAGGAAEAALLFSCPLDRLGSEH